MNAQVQRNRLPLANVKALLQDTTADMEASETGYIVVNNQKSSTWELLAPGGIHLETYRTKAEAKQGAAKRDRFNKRAGTR